MTDLAVLEGDAIEIDLPFVDDDGDALSYAFDVTLDGAPVTVEGLSLDGGTLRGSAPAMPGVYTVTVRASDRTAEASDS